MRWMWVVVGLVLLTVTVTGTSRADEFKMRGIVVDENGKGVKGATVASEWAFDADGGRPTPIEGAITGRDGTFEMSAPRPG